jgi:RND family efflux transporter MFP subunit
LIRKEDYLGNASRKVLKGILTILPIVLAILAVAFLVSHKKGPTRVQGIEATRPLRVIQAPSVDLVPRVVGYGVAEPGRIWEAVAQVKGTVSSTHPRLNPGELINAGSELVRIDPTEYELAIARLEAHLEEIQAQMKELGEEEESSRRLLAIERNSLELAGKSLARKQEALERKAISRDAVDREERDFLQQKQKVQQLENTLALIPAKQKTLKAALGVQQSDLRKARIDLAKTTIRAPFDCRLSEVAIEAGQFVRIGEPLFKAHGTAVTEVEARFRTEELRRLLGRQQRSRFQPGLVAGAFEELFSDIQVAVSLQSGDLSVEWEGRMDRLREDVDPRTREMKVVAAVDYPYQKAIPGVRPPLTAGMFCRVELRAPARPGSIVIPRSAVHDGGIVFVVDQENRLRKKEVVVDFTQEDFVVIRSGLLGGETVIVSDPTPAVQGMKIRPVIDDALKQALLASSRGEKVPP